jgi:hypothetical protein
MLTLSLVVSALLQAGSIVPPPRADSTVVLAPGDTVRVFNSFIHEGGIGRNGAKRFDVLYATRIPVADGESRAAQADRAAQVFGPRAAEMGVRRLSIGICDTQSCAQRRDPPAAWFLYERTAQGWRRIR